MLLPMSPADSMFLLGESREHPMHVGGLVLLDPHDGADAADIRTMLDHALARDEVTPLLRKRASRSLTSLGQWRWEHESSIDLKHHVRHAALPAPGGMPELMDLVARLHAGLLDRHRPLWEMYLIEGLADGRFAVYTKIHHALADGVSAMRLLRSALSEDPDERSMPAPWEPLGRSVPESAAPDSTPPPSPPSQKGLLHLPVTAVRAAADTIGAVSSVIGEITAVVPALAGALDRARHDQGGALSLSAPRSMFNVPIGGARRFAARSWPLERLRLVAKRSDATVNDVVLAMCAGALRAFMTALDALPETPLIAMVPVSLRNGTSESKSGNNIGMLSCNLGTHLADPADRLEVVRSSMNEGKGSMRALGRIPTLAASAFGAVPLALGMYGLAGPIRPPNVMISNVPGPAGPLYWNGARVSALYPLSLPVDGQALNITCTSTDDEIAFGLTGCRRAVPDLDPLLEHLDNELTALEAAVA
ncbi:wax ester/triacylglycerol synthase family O-acyltransferase [Prescottella agglutinans]|uniref:Diacylglycerol O-acyltransferase n=1 Tax=Prescottella agglutinans TaxID=1644129 RepID=A0A438BCV9_9NOCA|nr:wax ester/triacylglycerol synthase family O-acyltransferase [Prescottella agglutinans]RVW08807.1 wax ester/triacylglycerol synthase family O-acyltransferase [Prescottella agglutinans]